MPATNLGEFELLVLLACLRLGDDEAYAVSIVDEIYGANRAQPTKCGSLRHVRRLEDKGLIRRASAIPGRSAAARLAGWSTSSDGALRRP